MTFHPGLIWRKARLSEPLNNCVEVARMPGGVAVRDSKNPQTGLTLTRVQARQLFARLR